MEKLVVQYSELSDMQVFEVNICVLAESKESFEIKFLDEFQKFIDRMNERRRIRFSLKSDDIEGKIELHREEYKVHNRMLIVDGYAFDNLNDFYDFNHRKQEYYIIDCPELCTLEEWFEKNHQQVSEEVEM